MNRSWLAFVVVCACGGGSSALPVAPRPPQDPPSALIAAALESHRAHDIAESLADEVGPRLAGSPGDPLAVAWAQRTMRDIGLANVHTEAVTVPVWKRGAETAQLVEPSRQPLAVTALGWSGATPADGITAEVMEVDSLAALRSCRRTQRKEKSFSRTP